MWWPSEKQYREFRGVSTCKDRVEMDMSHVCKLYSRGM